MPESMTQREVLVRYKDNVVTSISVYEDCKFLGAWHGEAFHETRGAEGCLAEALDATRNAARLLSGELAKAAAMKSEVPA